MQHHRFFSYLFPGMILGSVGLLLLALQFFWYPVPMLGIAGLFLYVSGVSILSTGILYRVFRLQPKKWSTWMLGIGWMFLSLCIALGIPIIFTTATFLLFWIVLVVYILFLSIFFFYTVSFPSRFRLYTAPYSTVSFGEYLCFSGHYLWPLLYGVVWFYSMATLFFFGPSESILLTPWQALPLNYLISFVVASILLVILLFSRAKTSVILTVLVLHSVLLHMYIPMASIAPFGGDVWRHIGRVSHILMEEPIRPILFGTDIAMTDVAGFSIPSVFVHVQKYAYSMLWGGAALLYGVVGISLEHIFIWFVPIIWSVFIPIIFFFIGYILFGSQRKGLILSSLLFIFVMVIICN